MSTERNAELAIERFATMSVRMRVPDLPIRIDRLMDRS
jgi:hypothetical protein